MLQCSTASNAGKSTKKNSDTTVVILTKIVSMLMGRKRKKKKDRKKTAKIKAGFVPFSDSTYLRQVYLRCL